MIEHLESHESEWVETPMASRNKSLLKKWKDQLKVIRLLRQRMAFAFTSEITHCNLNAAKILILLLEVIKIMSLKGALQNVWKVQ